MAKTAPTPPRESGKKRQHQIRMEETFRARVSRYQEKLEKTTGMSVTFSDAMRSLLEKGLQASEKGR